MLQRELEASVKARKKEALEQEKNIYGDAWNDINAAITQYAKQHDINLVLRRENLGSILDQPPIQGHLTTHDEDAATVLKRISAVVVYRSHAADSDAVDITQEVLAGLNHAASGPEKSAK